MMGWDDGGCSVLWVISSMIIGGLLVLLAFVVVHFLSSALMLLRI